MKSSYLFDFRKMLFWGTEAQFSIDPCANRAPAEIGIWEDGVFECIHLIFICSTEWRWRGDRFVTQLLKLPAADSLHGQTQPEDIAQSERSNMREQIIA